MPSRKPPTCTDRTAAAGTLVFGPVGLIGAGVGGTSDLREPALEQPTATKVRTSTAAVVAIDRTGPRRVERSGRAVATAEAIKGLLLGR
jgi:hypothetical protein